MAGTALTLHKAHTAGKFTGMAKSLYGKYLSSEKAKAKIKEKTEETVGAIIDSTVTLGSTAVLAAIQGVNWDNKDKNGKPTFGVRVGPIPLDLGVGAALHLGALFGLGGKVSNHLRSAGNGAMASFVATWARGMGYKWAQKRKGAPGGSPSVTGAGLADDVANMLAQ